MPPHRNVVWPVGSTRPFVRGTLQQIEETLELGARFICHGADILAIKRNLEKIRDDCKALGFTFDDPVDKRVVL